MCSQCSKKVGGCWFQTLSSEIVDTLDTLCYSINSNQTAKNRLLFYHSCILWPQMRLPSKPYSTLPIYSLGPVAAAKEEASGASAPAEPEKHPFGSGHSRHSLRRSVYKYVTTVLHSPFFLHSDEMWLKMSCYVTSVHYFFLSSGYQSTAAAAKMAGRRMSQTCPRSSRRIGSPWRSAWTAKSSSRRSSPPASATCAWPASVPVSIAKPSPSTCHRPTRSTSCPLSAPSTRCRKCRRLVCFWSRLSQS